MRKFATGQINQTSPTRSRGEARRCPHCGALAPLATVEPSVAGLEVLTFACIHCGESRSYTQPIYEEAPKTAA